MDSLKYATPWEWVGWAEWVKEFGDGRDRVVIGGETPRNPTPRWSITSTR